MRIALALVAALAVSSPAYADIITINANDYPLGTDLSNIIPGLSLAKLDSLHVGPQPVLAVTTRHDPNSLSFGGSTGDLDDYDYCSRNSSSTWCNSYGVLELSFDAPTDFVQFQGALGFDPATFMAYNAAGEKIAGFGTSVPLMTFGTRVYLTPTNYITAWSLTASLAHPDIARLVIGGIQGGVSIEQISYNAQHVPEPTTLGLMVLGLLGAGLVRKRHHA